MVDEQVTPPGAATDPGPRLGGHDLPPTFSSTSPVVAIPSDIIRIVPSSRGRRNRPVLAWSLSVAGVLLLAGAGAALQLTANLGYDQAHTRLTAALTAHDDEKSRNTAARVLDDEAARASAELLGVTDAVLLGDADRATLTSAQDRAQKASAASASLTGTATPEPGVKPSWFWELYSRTAALDADSRDVRALTSALEESSKELGSATGAIGKTGLAVVTTAGGLAAQIENENRPSPNEGVLTLREMAARLTAATAFDEPIAQDFVGFAATAQKVRDGHA
ncbi:MAG: hypothetical protein JSS74_10700, partial [Actinobacteria bacterium]|nr:hypothetical protein [Actinomycetota bacterium]